MKPPVGVRHSTGTAMSDAKEDRYAKYANFEADEDARTEALRRKRSKEGHGGNEFESFSGDGSAQRCKMGQRISPFRLK